MKITWSVNETQDGYFCNQNPDLCLSQRTDGNWILYLGSEGTLGGSARIFPRKNAATHFVELNSQSCQATQSASIPNRRKLPIKNPPDSFRY